MLNSMIMLLSIISICSVKAPIVFSLDKANCLKLMILKGIMFASGKSVGAEDPNPTIFTMVFGRN